MGNTCIEWITKMGADAPLPPNTMNAAAPKTDAPSGVFGCSFLISVIPKKCLAQRG
jgi:hypothetical protein